TDRYGRGGAALLTELWQASGAARLTSAWRLRFASLPTRIVVAVFSAALVTGIAVTAISIGSTQRFLRAKIDERFPGLLTTTAHDLDQWYAQRELDIATFAASETVVSGVRPAATERAVSEARRYLAYVEHGFPQYRRLFVLGPRAEVRMSVGTD